MKNARANEKIPPSPRFVVPLSLWFEGGETAVVATGVNALVVCEGGVLTAPLDSKRLPPFRASNPADRRGRRLRRRKPLVRI
ncbi:hypothetical protein ACFFQF_12525 [Haladaptatus pallidirubidus]